MMKISIRCLTDFSINLMDKFIYQIANWHLAEWGKYHPNKEINAWHDSIYESVMKRAQLIFIALDQKDHLLGSVSLKSTNMDNMFPDLTPWLSGLYVTPECRGKKLSALLIRSLVETVIKQQHPFIYLFSHNLALENYYTKFGWEIMQPPSGDAFYYREAPILLFRGKSALISEKTDSYIKQFYSIELSENHSTYIPYANKNSL